MHGYNAALATTAAAAALGVAVAGACGGPQLESRTASRRTYQAVEPCGQGPIEAAFEATGARWGESVEVVACGARDLRGRIEVAIDGVYYLAIPFGSRTADNARCLAGGPVTTAAATPDQAGAAPATRAENAADTAATAAPASRATRQMVREIDAPADVCPDATRTQIALGTLRAGARIDVKLWSREPNDLEDALFRLEHLWHEPNVSEDEWRRHLAKEEAERAARDRERQARRPRSEAALRRELARAETYAGPREPDAPPPPPRAETPPPPPPSLGAGAAWVPGYWRWEDASWVWVGGRWRAPATTGHDARDAQVAPPAPPPRAETPPPPPPSVGARAVWTPGHWRWNGRGFEWVAGGWRIAPRARR